MLKVTPIQEKSKQQQLCEKCNTEYDPDALAYAAFSNEEFAGISQFRISKGFVKIISFAKNPSFDSNDAMLIMGRTIVTFAYNFGCETAYLEIKDYIDEKLARIIGFIKNENGVYTMDIKKYIDSPCEGCK